MFSVYRNIVELMPNEPCHVTPFVRPGILIGPAVGTVDQDGECSMPSADGCDYCGSARLEWRKCKLVCADCRQINKSCADL